MAVFGFAAEAHARRLIMPKLCTSCSDLLTCHGFAMANTGAARCFCAASSVGGVTPLSCLIRSVLCLQSVCKDLQATNVTCACKTVFRGTNTTETRADTTEAEQLQTCQRTPAASRPAQPPRLAPALRTRIYREGRPATKPALRLSLRSLPGSSGGTAAAAAGCPASPALKPSSDRSCLAIRFLAAECSSQHTTCTGLASNSRKAFPRTLCTTTSLQSHQMPGIVFSSPLAQHSLNLS